MGKNVYVGYLASAEIRSASEKKFERFCETCDAVDWVYKNGDKGAEYFSIRPVRKPIRGHVES